MVDLLTFGSLAGILVSLVLGFLIGVIVKKVISLGLLFLALVLLLMALGYVHPSFITSVLDYVRYYGPKAAQEAQHVASLIPYSSVFFIIGFIIGIWKG